MIPALHWLIVVVPAVSTFWGKQPAVDQPVAAALMMRLATSHVTNKLLK